LIIANADDAPGAIFIFGGIALLGSGLICGIGIGLTKTLLEIKEQLEK
jgi:hypothetical protein